KAQVSRAVDLLDKYAQALADPDLSLRQLEPLVKGLEGEVENLEALGQGLPEGHGLKDLADRTAIQAAIEALKFRRGDFQ
ncbi:MAG: hypothetical protein AB1896_20005, partial [Thermodesulfobacteriota bacterium]